MAEVREIGVVGAGFMGSGIAESAARAGLRVRGLRAERGAAGALAGRIETSVERAVHGGKMDESRPRTAGARPWLDELDSLHGSELVVEAIVEDLEVEQRDVRAARRRARRLGDPRLEHLVDPDRRARRGTRTGPTRVLGLHFFSPVPVMKLVEIVVALDTRDETITKGRAFVAAVGKRPIHTKDRSASS